MNILFVIFDNINVGGGGPEVIKQIAPRLSTKGNRVSVITAKYGIRSDEYAITFFKKFNIDVLEIDVLSPTSIPTIKAKNIIRKKFNDADVIYFFLYMGGLERYLRKLQKKLIKPVICGHHSVIDNSNIKISFLQHIYYVVYGDRTGRTVRKFNSQHVLNKEDFNTLTNRKFENIFLIHNGIELEKYNNPRKSSDKFNILYLGRLSKEKGVVNIPTLLDLLKAKGLNNVRLIIVGDGPLRKYIESLTIKYDEISYLGYIYGDKKIEILLSSQVLVSFSSIESFFIAGLEAIASGTPVVAIDSPGVQEYINDGENGYIVKNIEEMSEKIAYLYNLFINDYDTYSKFANKCREYSLSYTWDSIVEQYEKMFSKAINDLRGKGNDT